MNVFLVAAIFFSIGNGMNDDKIAQYPVTNAEYAQFIKETGHQAPRYWYNGEYPNGKGNHPVLWVSFYDAQAYCDWLSEKDSSHTYRLPTEEEWERAAGPTPRNAEFNYNGVVAAYFLKKEPNRKVTYIHQYSTMRDVSVRLSDVISFSPNGGVRGWVNHQDYTGFIYTDLFKEISDQGGWTTAVNAYPKTKAACGALDMWGNCWEWTSTEIVATNGAERGKTVNAIKGGSWYANRSSCMTEFKGEGRRPGGCFNTVGFRIVQCSKNKSAQTAKTQTEKQLSESLSSDLLLVRIAEIEVYPKYLTEYIESAKAIGAESVENEPGVVCIFPMQMKEKPNVIRIVEIYRDQTAYDAHLKTQHYLTYKQETRKMIKSLKLVSMLPLDTENMNLIFRKGLTE